MRVTLRGVGPLITAVRPELKILEGRMFNPAVFEIIVGKAAQRQFKDLDIDTHHSIRLKVGVKADAKHPGGINIFGRGFGNYDQDIVLRLHTKA